MRISYFIAGLVLLLNPNYGIIDVLPDVIGYALILKSIEHAADLYEYISDAKNLLSRLCIVSVAKLAATVLCNVTDQTFVLVLTFAFVIVELIYIVPAFIKLYNGIGYSAMRLSIPGVPEATPRIRNLTVTFFVLRAVFALVPELSSLLYSSSRLFANSDLPENLKKYLTYLCIPLMLIFAAVVLVYTVRYTKMCKVQMYCTMVDRAYELHFSGRHGLFRARSMNTGISCIMVAALFSLDFHFDQMDVIPDAAGAIFLLIAVFLLATKRYEKIIGVLLSACYAVASVLNILVSHEFNQEYSLSSVFYTAAATNKYVELEIWTALEVAFGFGSFLFAFLMYYKEIKRNTKLYSQRLYAINPDECAQDYVYEVRRSLFGCIILSILHLCGKMVYILVLPYSNIVSVLSAITTVFWMLRLLSLSTLVQQGLGERIREF